MTPIQRPILVGFAAACLLFIIWAYQRAPKITVRTFAPVYAFDPTTKTWFTTAGNAAWPCQTPSGDKVGLEVVMAKAPDGKLLPVLLLRTDIPLVREVQMEGITQQQVVNRRQICDPSTMAWVTEDSKAGAQLYARIKDLATKGYTLDVRPPPADP